MFTKKAIGLDIGDESINIVELEKSGKLAKIVSLAHVDVEPGIISKGKIKDADALGVALGEAFNEATPSPIDPDNVIWGFPKSQVYTHVFTLEPHDEGDRDALVREEALGSVPLDEADLIYSYRVIGETEDSVRILLVAVSREVAGEWQSFFKKNKINVDVFDIESLALYRSLFPNGAENAVCIVDVGGGETSIDVFTSEGLGASFSTKIAGNSLTLELSKELKIKPAMAEEKKKKAALNKAKDKVYDIIVKSLDPLLKEVKSAIKYFEKESGQKVLQIYMVGGTSRLTGITDYFQSNLKIPVALGECPCLVENEVESMTKKEALEFVEAAGLALRGVDKKWSSDLSMDFDGNEVSSSVIKKEVGADEADSENGDEPEEESAVFTSRQLPRAPVNIQVRVRIEKLILVGVLVMGAFGIGTAYWFRTNETAQAADQMKETVSGSFNQTQLINSKVSIALSPEYFNGERVRGRIIENKVDAAANFDEARVSSEKEVQKELKESEVLWSEPLNRADAGSTAPFTIKWLVVNDADVSALLLNKIKAQNKNKTKFIVNSLEKIKIELTANSKLIYLYVNLNIAPESTIEIDPVVMLKDDPSVKEAEAMPKQTVVTADGTRSVLIKPTETGWLNVRSGAAATFGIIAKINPGEKYPLLQESGEWYKIKLADGQEGFVSANYCTIE